MTDQHHLVAAVELVAKNSVRFPNESAEYRDARNALLAEEIELRRHLWRVAEQRRDLPQGGEISQDYQFEGKQGPVALSEMFGDHDTLSTPRLKGAAPIGTRHSMTDQKNPPIPIPCCGW